MTNNISKDLHDFINEVITPFLLSFVYWVIEDAKKRGIKSLYFVSRDGQILYKIAKQCFDTIENPSFHYLYGSRHAWYRLPLKTLKCNELEWMTFKHLSHSPRDMLAKFDFQPEDFSDVLTSFGLSPELWDKELSLDEMNIFCKFLSENSTQKKLLDDIKVRRNLAINYFKQKGLFSDQSWALVDTGWTLRSQFALNSILIDESCPKNTFGYYIGIKHEHVDTNKAGNFNAFYLQKDDQSITPYKIAPWLFNQGISSVLEEVFTMADHGSLIGYEQGCNGKYIPKLRKISKQGPSEAFIKQWQRQIINTANRVHKTLNTPSEWSSFIECSSNTFQRFIENPTVKEVEAIKWIPMHIDQTHNSKDIRILANPLTFYDIWKIFWYMALGQKGRFEAPNHGWYTGCAILSNWWIKNIFFILKRFQ